MDAPWWQFWHLFGPRIVTSYTTLHPRSFGLSRAAVAPIPRPSLSGPFSLFSYFGNVFFFHLVEGILLNVDTAEVRSTSLPDKGGKKKTVIHITSSIVQFSSAALDRTQYQLERPPPSKNPHQKKKQKSIGIEKKKVF